MFNAGKALKKAMVNRDMSNIELAQITGLSRTRISHIRANQHMSTESVVKFAKILGYSPSEFIKLGENDV
jgi:plasmid maintenance system antidote protein VapI